MKNILRRAVNIPLECQGDGLVLEIFIQNCDGTRYKKKYDYKDSEDIGMPELRPQIDFHHFLR